ncbi:MAG TPA: AbrB/MazE/SpoVT family DNA-binding domain-containing protein [Sediminispirochaeta sp.]|nr:AbrB/MazE/SpoVT family DNA-binding domain-containing protein [Sediminispirochaeta sp.]
MKAHIIKIGNSKGIRLPKKLLDFYSLKEGSEIEIEETRDGIFLKPLSSGHQLTWEEAYCQMAAESAEAEEWSDWDRVSGDGITD